MEILTATVSIIFLLGLISTPILLFIGVKKWNRFKFEILIYLALALIITAGIMGAFAWWADYSNQLLLSHYGYNFDAMNESERFSGIANENLEMVKQLEKNQSGIGWPLKAIMLFAFYAPYLLIVYLIGLLIRRRNKFQSR